MLWERQGRCKKSTRESPKRRRYESQSMVLKRANGRERETANSHQRDGDQHDHHAQPATRPRTSPRQSHPRDRRRRHPEDEFDAVQDRVGFQGTPAA